MNVSADRVSGLFFLLFGLALFFIIIPSNVETTEGSNLAPSTVPNYIAGIIAFCGALLILKPTNHQLPDRRYLTQAGLYAVVLAGGIYAMSWFGFEYIAPVLAFMIMMLIGERRPLWLASGVVIMPLIIWFLVTHALGRALP